MRLVSIQSRRQDLIQSLKQCRQKTWDLLAEINSEAIYQQVHPDFSPIGWHFGHIALVEAYWILEHLVGLSPLFSEYRQLFAADGLPKAQRQYLPSIETIRDYLTTVREAVLDYLEIAPIETEERLWRWLIQHESQHNETIIFLWHFYRHQHNLDYRFLTWKSQLNWEIPLLNSKIPESTANLTEMVKIPAGEFIMGSNEIYAQDNERPAHKIYLESYWIDPYPVTCQQYREFIQAGGYQNSNYWSAAGWQWLQDNPVSQPLYWSDAAEWQNCPICGVNYYEAEAYAKFAGKRLPSEAEWEKAATPSQSKVLPQYNHDNLIGHITPVNTYPYRSIYGCYDMLGNVWEWTASWFEGYRGFSSYPYQGYSQDYFDNQHRVLRGGSWASRPWTVRTSFRNWYNPQVRQILAGFRCAAD
ncbi:MAG: SUMF1/EgtB/PvdO family nonheme iron enzyme [Pleurocapsa sp.]